MAGEIFFFTHTQSVKLRHNGIWEWGIHGLNGWKQWGSHGLNGWGICHSTTFQMHLLPYYSSGEVVKDQATMDKDANLQQRIATGIGMIVLSL